jgi:RNA polymerase sigma-70 factor (ECF subfamily)
VIDERNQLASWMAAAQKGDEHAYRSLLEAIQPMVFGYVRKRISSTEAAEDVSQDVLLTLHRVRHTYSPDRPFEPWLFAIARSRLIDYLRKLKRISSREVMMDVMPEARELAGETTGENALDVLDKLPAGQREAFSMLKIEGLSTREAAERAGISVSALKVRAHRAYNAIKKSLAGDADE